MSKKSWDFSELKFILFYILKRVKSFFTGSDLYGILNIIDEYFSVSDMTGIENFFSCFNDCTDRHLADHNFHLYLGKKADLLNNSTVILGLALLSSSAENVGHRHSGNTDAHKSVLKSLKFFLFDDKLYFCYLCVRGR